MSLEAQGYLMQLLNNKPGSKFLTDSRQWLIKLPFKLIVSVCVGLTMLLVHLTLMIVLIYCCLYVSLIRRENEEHVMILITSMHIRMQFMKLWMYSE